MKILQVIHGFPPYYMAGSEVYTFNLCKELAKTHDVWVFSRVENPYEPKYTVKKEESNGVQITRVNKPPRDYTFRSKFIDERTDEIFKQHVSEIDPDIAHIGHLSHLSTNIVRILKEKGIPIVQTLHDFWMVCLRGQLLTNELKVCKGPTTEGCMICFAQYFLSNEEGKRKVVKWENHMEDIRRLVDFYIAPSRFLRDVFIKSGIKEDRIVYLDYGFDVGLFKNFRREKSDHIRFGFLGRIIPAKGAHLLIDAFNEIGEDNAELSIYGALPPSARYLRNRAQNPRMHFKGPYDNRAVASVLSQIDVLVVPSIWYENSPLVIHEAFLTKTPVIATNLGGMAEYVNHGENGLLFELGNANDLREKIRMIIHDPGLLQELSKKDSPVRTIEEDAASIVRIYEKLLKARDSS